MVTYKARFLPRDIARCLGNNCNQKEACARHTQIELDKQHDFDTMWIVYADALRDSAEQCDFMIGEM